MEKDIQSVARRTIHYEAQSIQGLEYFINDEFEKAIQLIYHSSGRLVVTGIGKSAIIGQKIVATFNSTGTPSLFMHAADALHGDMGMIQKNDVVLIISKSGESPEIKALPPFIKNFGNTIIAMVGNMQSTLAREADIILNTTVSKEACPNNLAPTSSTTAQMVMGDAIAVCLMELNGFTGNDFARYHPGGNLGKRLYLKVDDIFLHNEKPRVKPTDTLKEVIMEISHGRMGATVVTDDQNIIMGIITDGDIRRLLEKTNEISKITAQDILTSHPKKIESGSLAMNAMKIMKDADISQLVICGSGDEYLGIIHIHDLVREGLL
ncbi:MAG: KpsF/GutQ family sugar-phosphate isomerase [Bacteroidetes bacterium]|nr:KpsF/GutQ family sugar-phosphate isomerase [Bacteroidota bacterium]